MEASRLERDEKQEWGGKHYATENELIEGFYTTATAIWLPSTGQKIRTYPTNFIHFWGLYQAAEH